MKSSLDILFDHWLENCLAVSNSNLDHKKRIATRSAHPITFELKPLSLENSIEYQPKKNGTIYLMLRNFKTC